MKVQAVYWPELVSAIEQLWEWVGEQSHKAGRITSTKTMTMDMTYARGKCSAYSNVRLYMRKFFAGLIDFENGD